MSCVAWAVGRYVVDDDFAIGEDVETYPHDMLELLFHGRCRINVICVSSKDLGTHFSRTRKYMICLGPQKLKWQFWVFTHTYTPARFVKHSFNRRIISNRTIFYRAPRVEVEEFFEEQALKR